ncbi:MAG: hypothetical protein ABIL39_11575 [candidate division WOR-3 bacterium]
MKTLTTLLILLVTSVTIGQVQFGKKESFAFSAYVDPNASIKENGLDIGIDIEYRGAMYAKFGIESFAQLPGGYFDIHGGYGLRLTYGHFENLATYAGGRMGVAFRNGAPNPIAGFEGGVDYTFDSGLLIGINGSYIFRGDMKSMGWDEIWRENFYIRVGYSWDW